MHTCGGGRPAGLEAPWGCVRRARLLQAPCWCAGGFESCRGPATAHICVSAGGSLLQKRTCFFGQLERHRCAEMCAYKAMGRCICGAGGVNSLVLGQHWSGSRPAATMGLRVLQVAPPATSQTGESKRQPCNWGGRPHAFMCSHLLQRVCQASSTTTFTQNARWPAHAFPSVPFPNPPSLG